MALTLTTNPVETIGGVVNNIFPGFEKTEFVFNREDLAVISITSGSGTYIKITVLGDYSSIISENDSVYIYAEGTTYTYNETGGVQSVSFGGVNTDIEVDVDFIENASTNAYMNYLKNYYVEMQLVNVDNPDIKVIPFSLKDNGTSSGTITIDVSLPNYLNSIEFDYSTGQLSDMIVKFKAQYRQVYDGSSESFTLVGDEIILVFATEQPEIEAFISQFDYPELYEGYPAGVVLCHSDQNNDTSALQLTYDELDINQNDVVLSNSISTLISGEHGLIFADITGVSIDSKTEYIRFNGTFVSLADFLGADFLGADFATV